MINTHLHSTKKYIYQIIAIALFRSLYTWKLLNLSRFIDDNELYTQTVHHTVQNTYYICRYLCTYFGPNWKIALAKYLQLYWVPTEYTAQTSNSTRTKPINAMHMSATSPRIVFCIESGLRAICTMSVSFMFTRFFSILCNPHVLIESLSCLFEDMYESEHRKCNLFIFGFIKARILFILFVLLQFM